MPSLPLNHALLRGKTLASPQVLPVRPRCTRLRFRCLPKAEAATDPPPRITVTAPHESSEVLAVPDIRNRLKPQQSPFADHDNFGGGFVSDDDRIALQAIQFASGSSADARFVTNGGAAGPRLVEAGRAVESVTLPPWCMRAGARETIYFNPPDVRAAIVTVGGLCPGLNDVIQGLVAKLTQYGVKHVYGIRNGLRGFFDERFPPLEMTTKSVRGIHLQGGTLLGTSRGGADFDKILDAIERMKLDMVFVIGGNGGNAAADRIHTECENRGLNTSIVAIPKSIDNDILLIDRTFGFDSAVQEAQRAIIAGSVEAGSNMNGIGLVKVMGRSSGFIAMQASMASGVVDVTLIPEVQFELDGPKGLIAYVQSVMNEKGNCVICVAEGAGQELLQKPEHKKTDASGNPVLQDIGSFLKDELKKHIDGVDVKYIDPTYMVRAIPANSNDHILCKILAHSAVHAAFAGFSGLTVGLVNTHYAYLPIPVVVQAPRRVDPKGKMWRRLISSQGQPEFFVQVQKT